MLKVRTVVSSGLNARSVQLGSYIFSGEFLAVRANAASFKLVRREILDVRSQLLRGHVEVLREAREAGQQYRERQNK
jgi:hypothetical protein